MAALTKKTLPMAPFVINLLIQDKLTQEIHKDNTLLLIEYGSQPCSCAYSQVQTLKMTT